MRISSAITVNILAAGLLFAGAAHAQNSGSQQSAGQPAAAPAAKPSLTPQQANGAKPGTPPAPAQPAPTIDTIVVPGLDSEKAKISYAIGMLYGTGLHRQTVEVDESLFEKGFHDALSGGSTLITEDQLKAILNAFQTELRQKQQEKARLAAETNKKDGDAFLQSNKTKEGVVALPSGLEYKILTAGTGPKPAASDTVICNYRGTLIDGTVFDASEKHGGPATFPVSGVIRGWTEALQLMPVGSKWELFVPSELAYGERGAPPNIGPNAALIFEVELLSIKEKPQPAQPAAQAPGSAPSAAPPPPKP
jgi:FKBP-type peptidyl-prolyl cis-trans isomerase FklB